MSSAQDHVNAYLEIIQSFKHDSGLTVQNVDEHDMVSTEVVLPKSTSVPPMTELQLHHLSNESELDLLRVKNATKNGIINRLRHMNNSGEVERKILMEEIKTPNAQNIVNKCIMAAKIKDLEKQLENATQELSETKTQGPRIRKGYVLTSTLIENKENVHKRKNPNELFADDDEIGDNVKKKSRGRPSTTGGSVIRSVKSNSKGVVNTLNYTTQSESGAPLWGASGNHSKNNSADAIVNDLLEYEGSLESASSVDFNDFSSMAEAHKGLSVPKQLVRQTNTTSTFSAQSVASVGEGFGSRDEQDAADNTSSTAVRNTRPSNRTKSIDYYAEEKLAENTTSSSKLERQSSADKNDALPQPKSLTDHCNVVVLSSDPTSRIVSLEFLIKRFGTANGLSINKLYELGLHQTLSNMLSVQSNNNLLHKGMVVLNNLIARSTPEQFQRIMQIISVPQLVALVSSKVDGIQEQAIWILDNIALDCGKYRAQAMKAGTLPAVLEALKKQPSKAVLIIAAKSLRTLTTANALNPGQHLGEIRGIVATLPKLLVASGPGGSECILSACATLSNLTEEEDKETIDEVFKCVEVPRRLVELASLSTTSPDTQFFAIDSLGHLAGGSEQHTQTLLDMRILSALRGAMLNVKAPSISSAACRCVSNITAGSSQAIQAVVEADLFPLFISLFEHSADQNVRLYAAYAIMFAFHGADLKQTQHLVNAGCIPLIVGLLRTDVKAERAGELIVEALTALEMLLYKFEFISDFNHVASIIEKAGGWESVNRLRSNSDPKIRGPAIALDVDSMRASLFKTLINTATPSGLNTLEDLAEAVAPGDEEVANDMDAFIDKEWNTMKKLV